MKPLKTELQDTETLRDLGSASVQVVHDLKNQLNGLKLYATFLRKRMEKAERPADEQETLGKLISGLERAASDMNVLVRFGRALELRRQPGTDLARLLQDSADGARVETDGGPFEGDFDPVLLAEALKNITAGAYGESGAAAADDGSPRHVRLSGDGSGAVVEWQGGAAATDADGEDCTRARRRSLARGRAHTRAPAVTEVMVDERGMTDEERISVLHSPFVTPRSVIL